MSHLLRLDEFRRSGPSGKAKANPVYFARHELAQLLAVYSKRVASGEWRDYAIDHKPGFAAFSVFRHTHEHPLFTVIKHPKSQKDGQFQLYSGHERLLRKADLSDLLTGFEKKLAKKRKLKVL